MADNEMKRRIDSFDWSETPVGRMEDWPLSLRSTVKTLLASRYPMVLTWGPELIQFYNDAYSALIGDKHPAALGIDIRITLAEAWDTLGPMIREVMRSGVANWTPALLLVMERSGYREESYFSVSHAPAEDDEGRIAGMLAVCSEVTQQVLGERRLRLLRDLGSPATAANVERSAEATCRDLMETLAKHPLDVPFALLYLRQEDGTLALRGAVGLATDASLELSSQLDRASTGETVLVEGVERHQLPGGPWSEPVRSALAMPIASSGTVSPLGALVAGVSPNRALDEGYSSFYELLARQVSVAIRNALTHEEERQRAEKLAELDRAKTTFFSNVSHELRTPLTLMLGPLEEALNDPELSGDQRARLEIAHRNSLRLLRLVNTLLDFSRIEAGRVQAVYEPLDLAELTADLASVFRSAIERAGLELVVDCPPLPEPVYVDRDQWEKIVLNLVSNAFKFTEQGGITVRQRAAGGHAELVVEDTGVGIPPSEIGNVFSRFHRVEGSRSRTHEGTGIGLALVQELVKLHGGEVRAESAGNGEGHGSRFTVTVPFGNRHLPADRIGPVEPVASAVPTTVRAAGFAEEAIRWLPDTQPEAAPAGEAQARILLADDNADMREYVRKLLSPRYEVIAVPDGEAAWEAMQARLPDLVLSDVMMPRLDGFGLLKRLRADPATRAVPVILLSARAGEEAWVVGLEAGADSYLVKPFSARELLARVAATLEMNRLRQESIRAMSELELERAARGQAEEANRLKDEFLATVSHELRTPLNAILGWSQILRQRGDIDRIDTWFQRGLAIIERSARAQTRLIDDLLDLGLIVSGKVRLDMHPLDLEPVVRGTVETMQPAADVKGVQLVKALDPGTGLVNGDPQRLQQIVGNLLSNAIKFTPEGGRVLVTVERAGSSVEIAVGDSGIGIDPEFLPHVFDRFRQADSSTTRQHGGMGIGLSIVKSLTELQGGTVQARSAGLNQGATFIVSFPIVPSEQGLKAREAAAAR